MNSGLTIPSPLVVPESIVVHNEGELPRGLYYYVITAIGNNFSESVPDHILQVYAGNKKNSITFEWKNAEGGSEYRIYRGTILGHYDGYFTVYGDYFCDDGLGELNIHVCNS